MRVLALTDSRNQEGYVSGVHQGDIPKWIKPSQVSKKLGSHACAPFLATTPQVIRPSKHLLQSDSLGDSDLKDNKIKLNVSKTSTSMMDNTTPKCKTLLQEAIRSHMQNQYTTEELALYYMLESFSPIHGECDTTLKTVIACLPTHSGSLAAAIADHQVIIEDALSAALANQFKASAPDTALIRPKESQVFSLVTINVRGLRSPGRELASWLNFNNPSVLVATETKTLPSEHVQGWFRQSCPGYATYASSHPQEVRTRSDSSKQGQQGVLIAIKEELRGVCKKMTVPQCLEGTLVHLQLCTRIAAATRYGSLSTWGRRLGGIAQPSLLIHQDSNE